MSSESVAPGDLDAQVEADDPYRGDDEYDDPPEPEEFDDSDAYDDDLALSGEPDAEPDDDPDDGYDPAELDTLAAGDSEPVLLVWPREEYEQVDQQWPEVLEPIGADSWDEYRRRYQALITGWTRRRLPPLLKVTGTADGFADWLLEEGADPLSVDLAAMAERYGRYLAEQADTEELPPAPGDPCWCGSGLSYGRCCRLLSPAS